MQWWWGSHPTTLERIAIAGGSSEMTTTRSAERVGS